MNMGGTVVDVENVTKIYPNGVVANRGVSLKVCNGEIVCLVGPNGAGKTTLIRQIMGLLRPTSGRVRVLGVDPFREQHVVRKNVGYVPQAPLTFPAHRVSEVLEYVVDLAGEKRARVYELLELLDLEDVRSALGYQLSLGQRKLLLIAMALAKNPAVLVMDEPTAFVDIIRKRVVWEIISKLKSQNKTVLLVSHDVEEVKRLCDRVYVMFSGRVVYSGGITDVSKLGGVELRIYTSSPSEVAKKIRHGVTRVQGNTLLASYTTLSEALKDLSSLADLPTNGLEFKLVLEYPSITSTLLSIADEGRGNGV